MEDARALGGKIKDTHHHLTATTTTVSVQNRSKYVSSVVGYHEEEVCMCGDVGDSFEIRMVCIFLFLFLFLAQNLMSIIDV